MAVPAKGARFCASRWKAAGIGWPQDVRRFSDFRSGLCDGALSVVLTPHKIPVAAGLPEHSPAGAASTSGSSKRHSHGIAAFSQKRTAEHLTRSFGKRV